MTKINIDIKNDELINQLFLTNSVETFLKDLISDAIKHSYEDDLIDNILKSNINLKKLKYYIRKKEQKERLYQKGKFYYRYIRFYNHYITKNKVA